MMRKRLLTVAAFATVLTVSAALAQQQQPQTRRVSGTIERVDGDTIYGKGPDGGSITLKLADNAAITAVLKATFADIKLGDYVGTGRCRRPMAARRRSNCVSSPSHKPTEATIMRGGTAHPKAL
jgi:hypothetical protein